VDPKTKKIETSGKEDEQELKGLASEYAALCKQVQISKEEVKVVDDLLKRLENLKKEGYLSGIRMKLFRHWYLGLHSAVSHPLLIYDGHKMFRDQKIKRIDFASTAIKPLKWNSEGERRHAFQDEKSGLTFELSNAQIYQDEVEICQLAKYLVEFDPRAMSLLTLIHFWARENNITLSNPEDIQDAIPDPGALEWLCLFLLGREGIIPTPKMLSRRTRKKGQIVGPPDTSFRINEDFVQEWKAIKSKEKDLPQEGTHEYVEQVLELIRAFFQFYTENTFRGSVLKSREAEVVSATHWMKPDHIYLMQPLFVERYFSLCQDKFENVVQPLMEKSLEKIEKYLKNIEENQERLMDLKSLFQPSVKLEKIEGFPLMDVVKPEKSESQDIKKGKPEEQEVQDVNREEPKEPEFQDIKKETAEVDNVPVFSNLMNMRCGCDGASTCGDETSLIYLFSTVCQGILLTTAEQAAVHEVESLLKIFLERFEFPSSQVILFRNHFWKTFKEETDKDLCVFIDHGAGKNSNYDHDLIS